MRPGPQRRPAPRIVSFPSCDAVPESSLQSLRELGGQLDARCGVEVPADLEFLSRRAQHEARAVAFALLQLERRAPRVELVARGAARLRHLDREPPGIQLD